MGGRRQKDVTRRQFLATAAGVAGSAISGLGHSSPVVTGGTSSATPRVPGGSGLPALVLTCTAKSGTYGWTFGQPFRQGDVPNGYYIQATNCSAFQGADIRTRWPDGSAQYAVLSGISSFSGNRPLTVQLTPTPTVPSGATMPEPTAAQLASVALTFTPIPTGYSIMSPVTLNLSSVVGVPMTTWSATSAGRVRQILGTAMSEFHYYQPVNSLLHVWWYVRAYVNGAIEIERVVENGWWPNVSANSQQDYQVSSYTSTSTTPDLSQAMIGYSYPTPGGYSPSFYTCPATGEITVAGGVAGILEGGGVPAVNANFYLNGNMGTIYTVTSSRANAQGAPAWSSTMSYVQHQFVRHKGWLYQAAGSSTNQAPTGTTGSNRYWTYVPRANNYCWMQTSTSQTLPLSTVASQRITSMWLVGHFTYSRWSRVDWIGGAPVTPTHNPPYLMASQMVPNYAFTKPDRDAWSGLASTPNLPPYSLGNWSAVMGNAGYQPDIGILPLWEALYCTSANPNAYAALTSNSRCSDRWPVYRRDSTTGRPVLYASYANSQMLSTGNPDDGARGGAIGTWNFAHHPSTGYLPYIVEGRWRQLEALQFVASMAILYQQPSNREVGGHGGVISATGMVSTRGAGWAWRTLGQAAAIGPRYLAGSSPPTADQNVVASHLQSLSDTVNWHYNNFIASGAEHYNTIGFLGQYDQYTAAPSHLLTNAWWGAHWMVNYQSMALNHAYETSPQGLTNLPTLLSMVQFSLLNAVLVMGDNSTFNFRCGCCLYSRPYLEANSTPTSPVFLSIPTQFSDYLSALHLAAPSSAKSGDSLFYRYMEMNTGAGVFNAEFSVGYGAAQISCLAMAIDRDVSGAHTAYNLATAAANYSPRAALPFGSDAPQFCIAPRT
jgi:hypothetical protein